MPDGGSWKKKRRRSARLGPRTAAVAAAVAGAQERSQRRRSIVPSDVPAPPEDDYRKHRRRSMRMLGALGVAPAVIACDAVTGERERQRAERRIKKDEKSRLRKLFKRPARKRGGSSIEFGARGTPPPSPVLHEVPLTDEPRASPLRRSTSSTSVARARSASDVHFTSYHTPGSPRRSPSSFFAVEDTSSYASDVSDDEGVVARRLQRDLPADSRELERLRARGWLLRRVLEQATERPATLIDQPLDTLLETLTDEHSPLPRDDPTVAVTIDMIARSLFEHPASLTPMGRPRTPSPRKSRTFCAWLVGD